MHRSRLKDEVFEGTEQSLRDPQNPKIRRKFTIFVQDMGGGCFPNNFYEQNQGGQKTATTSAIEFAQ